MSPEVLAHAMESYLESLKHQAQTAEAFFFGRLSEGMQGLLALPEDIRTHIDQLIWVASGGAPLDPTEAHAGPLIADAILFSVEERMGLH